MQPTCALFVLLQILLLLIITKIGHSFAPDTLRGSILSLNPLHPFNPDYSHQTITEKGIDRAVTKYFEEYLKANKRTTAKKVAVKGRKYVKGKKMSVLDKGRKFAKDAGITAREMGHSLAKSAKSLVKGRWSQAEGQNGRVSLLKTVKNGLVQAKDKASSTLDSLVKDVNNAIELQKAKFHCFVTLLPYKRAVQEIVKGNAATDGGDMANRADLHFDGEQLIGSKNMIKLKYDEAVEFVKQKKYAEARKAFGHALHTLQDFYSHTNWVEMGKDYPNPGIWETNDFGVPLAGPNDATCKSCSPPLQRCKDNDFRDKLTSGYFHSPIASAETIASGHTVVKPEHVDKCSHGGTLDTSSYKEPTGGINKDTSNALFSPHYYLHTKAAKLAVRDTANYTTAFRREIGDSAFVEFLALKPTDCHDLTRRSVRASEEPRPYWNISFLTAVDHPEVHSRTVYEQLNSLHPVRIKWSIYDIRTDPFVIPVDSTVEEMMIKLSPPLQTQIEIDAIITLTTPSGDSRVFNTFFEPGLVKYIRIEVPEAGNWRLRITGTGDAALHPITVQGVSLWDTVITLMTKEERSRHIQRPSLRILDDDEGLISGSTVIAYIITPSEHANVTRLALCDENGTAIENVTVSHQPIIEDGFSRHLAEFTVPRQKFHLVIHAIDAKGFQVTRETNTIYSPVGDEHTESKTGEGGRRKDRIAKSKTPPETSKDNLRFNDPNNNTNRTFTMGVAALIFLVVSLWLMAILAMALLWLVLSIYRTQTVRHMGEA